jgi:glycosyltransferase involved in cell wall biosynthesis
MRIAFYAPLKSPDHPVPSGDRSMARLLIAALEGAGHTVALASHVRSYAREPQPPKCADDAVARIAAQWRGGAKPDLWFCYHPYYKAPDAIGPALCREFAVPYVTAEASYASKRNEGPWAERQALVIKAVGQARLNICFTERDREGLIEIATPERCILMPSFIDTSGFAYILREEKAGPARLVAVAMMRPGDKFSSYVFLARALDLIPDVPWHLTVIGDGPLRSEVQALYAGFPAHQIGFQGEKLPEQIPRLLSSCDIYVWPGCGEAYGLAYLEAQGAGLPVVAQKTAGVPAVVRHGQTGLLTAEGDIAAYADEIRTLIIDSNERQRLSSNATRIVREEHSLVAASARLSTLLEQAVRGAP